MKEGRKESASWTDDMSILHPSALGVKRGSITFDGRRSKEAGFRSTRRHHNTRRPISPKEMSPELTYMILLFLPAGPIRKLSGLMSR